jgi:arylsulfatase A-like enzyme
MRSRSLRACANGAFAVVSLLACGGPRPAEPPRHLLLVVVDTLRADHLGCYGYARPTSPAIDALAARGVRVERAYATAPWTKPSLGSILTGLYPSAHGATGVRDVLSASVPTLAELLTKRGFDTGGVVSHLFAGSAAGFQRGFRHFRQSEAKGHAHVSTGAVTDQAIETLDRLAAGGRRFFLLVHYFDPHYRYLRHPEVGFAPPSAGRLDGSRNFPAIQAMRASLDRDEIEFLRALYDEEIRHTDTGIGRLLRAFDERGLAEETLVVVTADHGEAFMERGWLGHTRTLHEELVRVPLVIADPLSPGPRVLDGPVSLAALVPTLLELLGIEPASPGFALPSFAAALRGSQAPPATPLLAEVDFDGAEQDKRVRKQAWIDGSLKLIRDSRAGAVRLYDLDADPQERHDLARERPARTTQMREALDAALQEARAAAAPSEAWQPSAREAEMLRDLGYLEP